MAGRRSDPRPGSAPVGGMNPPAHASKSEKSRSVDQNRSDPATRVLAFVRRHAGLFARQGTLVAGWRQYTGFLSGTAPPAGSTEAGMTRGLVYVAAYLGFVLLVPIFVLAAFLMALVLRALRLLADR